MFAAHVKKCGSLRRAHPLVAIAGIEVSAQLIQIKVDEGRRVRAINCDQRAMPMRNLDHLGDRQDQCGRRSHVTEIDHPGRRFQRPRKCLDHLRCLKWNIDLERSVAGAAACAVEFPGCLTGTVLVVRCEHFVARPEPERLRDDVDADRGIVDEREVVRARAEKSAKRLSRLFQQAGKLSTVEVDRIALDLL